MTHRTCIKWQFHFQETAIVVITAAAIISIIIVIHNATTGRQELKTNMLLKEHNVDRYIKELKQFKADMHV